MMGTVSQSQSIMREKLYCTTVQSSGAQLNCALGPRLYI